MVAELAHRARFATDSSARSIVETRDSDDREGDISIETLIARKIDDLAAPFAQRSQYSIAAVAKGLSRSLTSRCAGTDQRNAASTAVPLTGLVLKTAALAWLVQARTA
jgi:hypothetical protein